MRGGREVRTDVVGVELVNTDEHADGRRTESPFGEGAEEGELARVEVVDEERIELCEARLGQCACSVRALGITCDPQEFGCRTPTPRISLDGVRSGSGSGDMRREGGRDGWY